jgi:hypothetical protein
LLVLLSAVGFQSAKHVPWLAYCTTTTTALRRPSKRSYSNYPIWPIKCLSYSNRQWPTKKLSWWSFSRFPKFYHGDTSLESITPLITESLPGDTFINAWGKYKKYSCYMLQCSHSVKCLSRLQTYENKLFHQTSVRNETKRTRWRVCSKVLFTSKVAGSPRTNLHKDQVIPATQHQFSTIVIAK